MARYAVSSEPDALAVSDRWMDPSPPYLVRLQLKEGAADGGDYPFSLPLIRCLDIEFTSPVTFFVGENGTGKSTVIETNREASREGYVRVIDESGELAGLFGWRSESDCQLQPLISQPVQVPRQSPGGHVTLPRRLQHSAIRQSHENRVHGASLQARLPR